MSPTENGGDPLEKLIDTLKNYIRVLCRSKDLSTSDNRRYLLFIQKNTRFDKDKTLNKQINEYIVDCGISHAFNNAWPVIKPNESDILPGKSLQILLSIIWNCSDKSESLCNSLVCSNVIEELIAQLRGGRLLTSITTKKSALYGCKAYLGILHNIVRNAFDSVPLFRSCGALKVLKAYIDCDTAIVKTKALLIACYVTNETEDNLINADSSNVQFIVDMLLDSLTNKNHYSRKHCFWSHELLCGLNHLSVCERNKRRILEAGVLEAYRRILTEYSARIESGDVDVTPDPIHRSRGEEFRYLSPFTNDRDKSSTPEDKGSVAEEEEEEEGDTAEQADENAPRHRDISTDKQLLADQTNPRSEGNVWTSTRHMTALECRLAVKGMWSLAFDRVCRRRILADGFFCRVLKKISTISKDEQIRKEVRGALWVLNSEDRSLNITGTATKEDTQQRSKGHVMLSYPWRYQREMLKVRDSLKLAGYNVWMDIDNMTGSTLEAMALAVEHCEVFVVAMCQAYKDSASCRTEAEYAYQLRKDIVPLLIERDYSPDGWLGLFVGTRLYFDVTGEKLLRASLPKIVNELSTRGLHQSPPKKVSKGERLAFSLGHEFTETRSKHIYRTPPVSFEHWSSKEVSDWLTSNNLECFAEMLDNFIMQDFTGRDLSEFKKMMKTAPEFFYRRLETLAGGHLVPILKFTRALDKFNVNAA